MATEASTKSIINQLNKFLNTRIRVRLSGGRELVGILRGHDAVVDLVLDNTLEILQDPDSLDTSKQRTRFLGLAVARGPSVTMIWPEAGTEEIPNPFVSVIT